MKRFLFPLITITVLGVSLPAWTQSATPQMPSRSYIGLKYLDLPGGLESRSGWVLGLQNNGSFKYIVSQVNDHKKGMVWLNRFLGHDHATGKSNSLIVDVVELPTLSKTQIVTGHNFCSQNGKRDENLIVIVEATNTEYRTQIHHAWKVDRTKEKIEKISPKGIVCDNPAFGI